MNVWTIEEREAQRCLATAEQPEPIPAAGEVLIRVKAVSLNYRDLINLDKQRPGNLPAPLIPCSDGAGEVAAVGEGVNRFKAGDRVAGIFFRDWLNGRFEMRYHQVALGGSIHGMLAEFVVLPEHALVAVPAHLSFEEAATLPCAGVTAWQALFTRGNLQAGASVLALGTGGVSIFALQLATAAGARTFITSSSDEKLERARSLGAAQTVNYKTTPDWEKEIWKLSEKRGIDHVMEVGGPGTLARSMSAVAAGGQIALIGVLTGFGPAEVSLFPLTARNVNLDGIYVGSRADFEALNAFLTKHQIHPIIDRTFGFAEAPAAFEYLRSGAHFGKIVITLP
jgi:NADPH:quinone reductase-like Zn-dependent oxidoreductase